MFLSGNISRLCNFFPNVMFLYLGEGGSAHVHIEIHKITLFISYAQDWLASLPVCLYSCHGHLCWAIVFCNMSQQLTLFRNVAAGQKIYTKPSEPVRGSCKRICCWRTLLLCCFVQKQAKLLVDKAWKASISWQRRSYCVGIFLQTSSNIYEQWKHCEQRAVLFDVKMLYNHQH